MDGGECAEEQPGQSSVLGVWSVELLISRTDEQEKKKRIKEKKQEKVTDWARITTRFLSEKGVSNRDSLPSADI